MERAFEKKEIELLSNNFFSTFEKIDLIYCREVQAYFLTQEKDKNLRENLTTLIEHLECMPHESTQWRSSLERLYVYAMT
jgi:chemotaxis methyl-accepting protein methylase